MASGIHGRRPIRESGEKCATSSPATERRSRPSSNSRSDAEYESGSDTEGIHHSPKRKTYEYQPESAIPTTSTLGIVNENKELPKSNNCSKSSTSLATMLALVGILFLIAAVAVVPAYLKDPVEDDKGEESENKYKNCSFVELENKYPSQDELLWKSLRIGIEGILNNEQPSPAIYLLLHNGKKSSENLVKKIILRATECFDPKSKPIELNAKDFSSKEATDDYGVIVKLYKDKIKEGGVTIVANLNEIPANTARALHTICDTYAPIAHKAVIFLTLVPSTDKGKPVEIAEKTLSDMWASKIGDFEFDPLLTRVTDQVFQLNPF